MTEITIQDLTESKVGGEGIFDKMMATVEAHIHQEWGKNRIKGPEYSTVYLGALQTTLDQAIRFLLTKDEAKLKAKQVELLEKQILQADEEILLAKERVLLAKEELEIARANLANIPLQGQLLTAQVAQTEQQTLNLTAEALNIPKQGALLVAQTDVQEQQALNLASQKLQIEAQTSLIDQQAANAIIEGTVLTAQECKLRAEYDLIMEQKLKTVAEAALLAQKKVTEQAQTSGTNIDADSVVGKQIQLYDAQRDGYRRDAEQKVAKLLVDSWNVRMTTNDTTEANEVNMLSDTYIGQAVGKLLAGVDAAP